MMKHILFFLIIALTACAGSVSEPRSSIGDLSQSQQKLVRESYKSLLEARQENNFPKMKEKARIILGLLKDYHDTSAYAAIAERRLEEKKEK